MHNIKLTDLDPENAESKTFFKKKKRMFKLELTDGYKTVHAMEMKPIKCLNTKIKPGTKVLIIGPVKVVNAIIFLESHNIEIIGGEVEEMLIENAYENVLLRLLKKSIVANPIENYAEPVCEEEAPPRCHYQQFKPLPLKQETKPVEQVLTTFMDDDDDDIDFDLIDQIEAEENRRKQAEDEKKRQEEESKKQRLEPCTTNEPRKGNFFLDSDEMSQQQQQQQQNANQIDLNRMPKPAFVPKANDLLIPDMHIELSENMEIDEVPLVQEKVSAKIVKTHTDDDYAYRLEGKYNYVTIDQYVQLSKRQKMERTYAIEGKMSQVIKLRIEGNEWVFLAKISDIYSKNLLPVRFEDNVVARFAKRTAREMNALRERMSEQPQLKMDLSKSIHRVNAAVEEKTLLMAVTMKMKLPTEFENIVELVIAPTNSTKQLILLKISNEKISLA
jgi:hypothetical protein